MKRIKKKKNPLSYCLLSGRSLWYSTSSQAQLCVKHKGNVPLCVRSATCMQGKGEGRNVSGASCGLLTKRSLLPSHRLYRAL